MNRRSFLSTAGGTTLAAVAPGAADGAAVTRPDARASHPGLEAMQRALWAGLDACAAFAREPSGRRAGSRTAAAVAADMSGSPYLLTLFSEVLGRFSDAQRPLPVPPPSTAACGRNDRNHVALVLALRAAIQAGGEVLAACEDGNCPVCAHVAGITNQLESPLSLIAGEAYWCIALNGSPYPTPEQTRELLVECDDEEGGA